MNADGSGVTRVGPRGSSEPAWSPDGTRIAAFVTGPPCRISCQPPQIWTFNPDGTGTAILSRGSWPA